MRRFHNLPALLACCTISLGCLSLAQCSLAQTSANQTQTAMGGQAANSKDAAAQASPVYLEYVPFDWETIRAIPRQEFADGLRRALSTGLDKAYAASTYKDIVRLTSPADIQAIRTLLKMPDVTSQVKGSGDTRLLFDADGDKTQIFVSYGGGVTQGTRTWLLSRPDFARLKQVVERVYAQAALTK